ERAVVVTHDNRFARLVSGNDQADLKLVKQLGQIRGVYAAKINYFSRLRCGLRGHCATPCSASNRVEVGATAVSVKNKVLSRGANVSVKSAVGRLTVNDAVVRGTIDSPVFVFSPTALFTLLRVALGKPSRIDAEVYLKVSFV